MEITLFDYDENVKTFDIGELNDIRMINIMILSGDEVASAYYKDGSTARFDSSNVRMIDYYDGEYCIYDIADDTNVIDAWKERKDSYDHSWWNLIG